MYKSKSKGKKIYAKRKQRMVRRRRAVRPSNYFVSRTVVPYNSTLVPAATVVLNSLLFSANQCADFPNFQNTFKEYKILNVKVIWSVENNSAESGITPSLGQVYTAIDDNDSTTPANIFDVTNYSNCKVTQCPKTHYRSFRPKPQQPIYNPLGTAFAPMLNGSWIPTQNSAVPHYALKYALVGGGGAGTSMVLNYKVIYTIAFRGQR